MQKKREKKNSIELLFSKEYFNSHFSTCARANEIFKTTETLCTTDNSKILSFLIERMIYLRDFHLCTSKIKEKHDIKDMIRIKQ